MSSFVTGQIVEARCSRCKDVTGHVIMACIAGVPVKVECRACGSIHKYVAPEAQARTKAEKPVRVRAGHARSEAVDAASRVATRQEKSSPRLDKTARKEIQKQEEAERQWNSVTAQTLGSAVPYRMDGVFAVRSLVEHPVFGIGSVMEIFPPDKMDVLFRDGMKRLRCSC